MLLVCVIGGGSLVATEERLFPSLGIFFLCLDFGFGFLERLQKVFLTTEDPAHRASIEPGHHATLKVGLRGKAFTSDQSPKITERCGRVFGEEPAELLAHEVVE